MKTVNAASQFVQGKARFRVLLSENVAKVDCSLRAGQPYRTKEGEEELEE